MGFLLRMFHLLKDALVSWAQGVQEAQIQPDWVLLCAGIVGFLLWFGSGCWASSIAENRRRRPLLHFILGILIPFVYPVVIIFAMGLPKVKKSEAEQLADEEAAQAEAAAAAAEAEAKKRDASLSFGPSFFEDLADEEDLNLELTYAGTMVRVSQVLAVLPEVVAVEIVNGDGELVRIRIPYAKIEQCHRV